MIQCLEFYVFHIGRDHFESYIPTDVRVHSPGSKTAMNVY